MIMTNQRADRPANRMDPRPAPAAGCAALAIVIPFCYRPTLRSRAPKWPPSGSESLLDYSDCESEFLI
jgi:hypothetical protein